MKTVRILLVDNTPALKQLMEQQLRDVDSMNVSIDRISTRDTGAIENVRKQTWDMVVFSDKIPSVTVARVSKSLNGTAAAAHTVVLTTQSEARVPKSLKKAGIVEMLNLADVRSPLFRWTFTSMLKKAEVRKKSENFDVLCSQIQKANNHLGTIVNSCTDPLGTIRTTLEAINMPELPEEKREFLLELLKDNVDKIGAQVEQLHKVQSELTAEAAPAL